MIRLQRILSSLCIGYIMSSFCNFDTTLNIFHALLCILYRLNTIHKMSTLFNLNIKNIMYELKRYTILNLQFHFRHLKYWFNLRIRVLTIQFHPAPLYWRHHPKPPSSSSHYLWFLYGFRLSIPGFQREQWDCLSESTSDSYIFYDFRFSFQFTKS